MSQAPYHPMKQLPLGGEDAHARMMAKLSGKLAKGAAAVNTPAVGFVPEAGAAAVASKPPLKWEELKPGSRGYYSQCRRYSVCSITIAGHEHFETWKLAGGGGWFHQLAGNLKSFAEAERVAQADANKNLQERK